MADDQDVEKELHSIVPGGDFDEPGVEELEDEELDTPEDVLNSGQYFDDISDDSVRLHLREIGKIPSIKR